MTFSTFSKDNMMKICLYDSSLYPLIMGGQAMAKKNLISP